VDGRRLELPTFALRTAAEKSGNVFRNETLAQLVCVIL
jgi:hypothetical protein